MADTTITKFLSNEGVKYLWNKILHQLESKADVNDITNITSRLTSAESSISALEAGTYDDTELQNAISTLVGNNDEDKNKSIRDIVIAILTNTLVKENADEAYDTLQEVSAWIKDHPESAATINSNIQTLQSILSGIRGTGDTTTTVASYITDKIDDAIENADLSQYALASDLTSLETNVSSQISTAISNASSNYATAAQGTKADTALQPTNAMTEEDIDDCTDETSNEDYETV